MNIQNGQKKASQMTLLLMAIACGLCAGSNYFNQPLLSSIQQNLSVSQSQAQFTVTIAQISYAMGLLLLVPLGDSQKKHIFIPSLMALAAFGLLLSWSAPNIYTLWAGTAITGFFSVAAQVLVPLSVLITHPKDAGKVIGLLMSGLFFGIYLSTSLSGLLSNLFSWNAIYLISALLLLMIALLLNRRIPHLNTTKMNYSKILSSMLFLIRTEPRLINRAAIGAFAFGSMSTLFSTMALMYSQKPFLLSDFTIGLIGSVGLVGALLTTKFGKLADLGFSRKLTQYGSIILLASWVFIFIGSWSIYSYVVGFTLINIAIPILHITNMNLIYKLREDAKARLNSIYMTLYFTGAASGSILGTFGWNHGGWQMTCIIGFMLAILSSIFAVIDLIKFQK